MRCVISVEPDSSPEACTIISQQRCRLAPHVSQAESAQSSVRMLGDYTLLEQLGEGGMGQVFKGQHHLTNRLVAVKTLPANARHDEFAIARFEREAQVALTLQHPNIIAAYEADREQGTSFIVMQYVDGQDLSAVVRDQGPLSTETAVGHVLQAARGLQFAHSQGIVHRDIKPANLLLDKQGVVRILDLGLARLESANEVDAQAELTITGTVMGTVDYMSPEQALCARSADARSDIYSLGCTLFYLLTGRPIYEGESLTARLVAHQIQPIPELSQLCPSVSAELAAIFRKMLAKSADERYQSMNEVIAALESLDLADSEIGSSSSDHVGCPSSSALTATHPSATTIS